jgi:hypothetical protein
MIACFFAFRNLDRASQLKLMGYVSNSQLVPDDSTPIVPYNQTQRHASLRLGQRVPLALENLADMATIFDPQTETPYFWDIHFAGESVAESVFTKCHFLIQACEHGLTQPNYNDEKLEVFEALDGGLYVNVDTTTKHGIRRAKELNLAETRLADVLMSPEIHLFSSKIFTPQNKGRLFALFRHPIDRAVSMYHYLASASWDPLYNPQLKIMSLEEYARSSSIENNWMTRFLVNKKGGQLTKHDMLVAKEILRTKCLVGLYEDLENTLIRFHRYFGWSQKAAKGQVEECRKAVLATGDPRLRTPDLERKGKVYMALELPNKFDLELYEYAKELYHVQGEQIFGIKASRKREEVAFSEG